MKNESTKDTKYVKKCRIESVEAGVGGRSMREGEEDEERVVVGEAEGDGGVGGFVEGGVPPA